MMELHEKRGNARYVHYPFSDVVPPPRLSKKRAIAKLIGNILQRVGGFECPHQPGQPTKQAQGAKLN